MARTKELKAAVAERVISAEIRRRSWRVQVLQHRVDGMLRLSEARATMYAEQKDEGHEFTVNDKDEELAAIAEGCRALPPAPVPPPAGRGKDVLPPPPPEYPKTMVHPGYPNGAETGMLMKDFRGKNAEQVVWKFDAALEAKIMEALKQAAIEKGSGARSERSRPPVPPSGRRASTADGIDLRRRRPLVWHAAKSGGEDDEKRWPPVRPRSQKTGADRQPFACLDGRARASAEADTLRDRRGANSARFDSRADCLYTSRVGVHKQEAFAIWPKCLRQLGYLAAR